MNLTTPLQARTQRPVWLWALLPLLLAAALSIPLLNDDAFTGDEPKTLFVAGVLSSGPYTLAGVVDALTVRSPEQALGWPILVFIWGRIAGWSEPAIRILPFLAGMLALALVARAGRDLLSPATGVIAALLLAGSAFFLTYMFHARAFTTVALCATLCVWCYWRITLRPGPPGRAAQAGLLLGAAGLLYMHYVGSLFLPALGLFHLLFVAKNRRWWRPVILIGLAALAATPQLPVFLVGFGKTVTDEGLHNRSLGTAELLTRLIRFMSNEILQLPLVLGAAAGLVLLLVLALTTLWRLRSGRKSDAIWLAGFVSATTLLLLLLINEIVGVVVENRIRYLMPLWPLSALLAGAGLWRLAGRHHRMVTVLLAVWLALGAWLNLVTGFRYESGYIRRSDVHTTYREVGKYVSSADGLILDHEAGYLDWQHLYVQMLDVPYVLYIRHRDDPLKHVLRLHKAHSYLWLLFLTQDTARMEAMADVLGRVPCERPIDGEWGITLVRHALSPVHCPDSPARLQFDDDIQLTGPDIRLEDGTLRLHAGFRSVDDYLLAHYSLAVHIIDINTDERVAQGDTGIGSGAFVPVSSEIDVSALPPGEYELRVALYDWQTGVRLPARDLETGTSGDMHAVHSFRTG